MSLSEWIFAGLLVKLVLDEIHELEIGSEATTPNAYLKDGSKKFQVTVNVKRIA